MPNLLPLDHCPKPRRGYFRGDGQGWTVLDRVPCATWACKYCGPRKQFKFQMRLKLARYNKFITLTHKPLNNETQENALRKMRHDWHNLHKWLTRQDKRHKITYICIVEWTKAGAPHLHILMDGPYIAQRKLSAAWKRLHNSPIVDIRRVRSDEGAYLYLTKYLTKDTRCPHRMRRWSSTRGFLPTLPPYANPNWEETPTFSYQRMDPTTTLQRAADEGYIVIPGPGTSAIIIWATETNRPQRNLVSGLAASAPGPQTLPTPPP